MLEPSSTASQSGKKQEARWEAEAGFEPGSPTWAVDVPHGSLTTPLQQPRWELLCVYQLLIWPTEAKAGEGNVMWSWGGGAA